MYILYIYIELNRIEYGLFLLKGEYQRLSCKLYSKRGYPPICYIYIYIYIYIYNITNNYIFPSELVNSTTFYLYPISITEFVNVVNNFTMKNSKDLFEIDINLIQIIINEIKYILQHLFNISISQGTYLNIL